MTTAAQRLQVLAEATTWVGTPYHHHARIKGVGVDCAQLLCGVFEACGLVPAVPIEHYPVDWHLHHSEEIFSYRLAQHAHQCDGPLEVGDVCLWRFGRTFSHGSIYAGNDLFIHSYIGRGVILSGSNEEPLQGRLMQHWSFW